MEFLWTMCNHCPPKPGFAVKQLPCLVRDSVLETVSNEHEHKHEWIASCREGMLPPITESRAPG